MRLKPRGSVGSCRSTHARCAGLEAAKEGNAEAAEIAEKNISACSAIPALRFLCVLRRRQKSNCALNLNRRGSTIDVGDRHPGITFAGEYAGFSDSTEFEFVTL